MNKVSKIVASSIILSSVLALSGCSSSVPTLGVENGQLMPCPSKPNCVNSFSKDEDHYIKPITIIGSSKEVKNAILNVVNTLDNSTITLTENSYIRAEFNSTIFGFVDDVEFYFPANTREKTIYIRSAARLGYSDFNVNRERVELIRLSLEALKK